MIKKTDARRAMKPFSYRSGYFILREEELKRSGPGFESASHD